MEEKKIKDLTGNREEKIASKRPVSPEKQQPAQKQTVRRPFVRMSQPASQMTEHLSGKMASGEERPAEPSAPKQEQPERRSAERNHDRPNRGHNNNNRHGGKNRSDRRPPKNRRDGEAKGTAPATEETAKPVTLAEPTPQPREKRRPDRQPKNQNKPQQDKQPDELRRKNGDRPQKNRPERTSVGNRPLTNTVQATPEPEDFTEEQLRADGLLFTLDEEPRERVKPTLPAPEEPTEQFEVIGVRHRGTGKTYYFSPNGITFAEGDHAILETVRGMEYGDVVLSNRMVGANEVIQPLKPVLRKATDADAIHFRENCVAEERARPIFLEKVQKNKLEMQLVDVEYTFDNTKLCFYFTAEGRVDFRELVKDLASVFRTRIELRQIGVRDEARMCGGLGVCGRPFCCKSYLADFAQVSIRMAKDQNLSLASSKISGSCGRLMCCLRYEQDTYEREMALLPRQGSTVDTPKGRAMVLESNFLTGKIKVSMNEDHSVRLFATAEVRPVEVPTPPPAPVKESEPAEAAPAGE